MKTGQRTYDRIADFRKDLDKVLHPPAKVEPPKPVPKKETILDKSKKSLSAVIVAILSQKIIYVAIEAVALISLILVVWFFANPGKLGAYHKPPVPVAYVGSENELFVIREDTEKIIHRMTFEGTPSAMVSSRDGKELFIANSGANKISVINPSDDLEVALLPLSDSASRLSLSKDGLYLYALCSMGGNIFVLNASGKKMGDNINLFFIAPGAADFLVSPEDTYLLASVPRARILARVTMDKKKLVTNSPPFVGSPGVLLRYSDKEKDEDYIIVAESDTSILSFLDPEDLSTKKSVKLKESGGSNPVVLLLDSQKKNLWICCKESNNLLVYNIANEKITDAVKVGRSPVRMAQGISQGKIWVVDSVAGLVEIVNPSTKLVDNQLDVGKGPSSIFFVK